MVRIKFKIPERINTKIKIYDMLGNELIKVLEKNLSAGEHELHIDESKLPNGKYFCKIDTEGFTEIKTIQINKKFRKMKNLVLVTIISLLITSPLFAQWSFGNGEQTDNELQKVTMLNPMTGYISHQAGVMRTTDAGISWSTLTPNAPSAINSVHFYDLNTGTVISTGFVVCNGGAIRETTDHGDTWYNSPSGVANNLNSVFILNESIALACGENIILKTTNRGVSWISQPISSNLRSISYALGYTLYCCGISGGKVYKTTNLGDNWTDVSGSLTGSFYSMCFTDLPVGYLCGVGGKLYKTTNGASSWNQISLGDTNTLNSIGFYGQNTGFVCGNNSKMYKTTNAGANWSSLNIPVTGEVNLNSLTYFFPNTILVVGSLGLIARSTNDGTDWSIIGIQQISSEVPQNYTLSQNYPNPFNPITNFEFQIADFGFVSIKIFDLTGREVESLVNKNLNAGVYKIDWNASHYSSGVYFYRLEADGFAETKKMILVK